LGKHSLYRSFQFAFKGLKHILKERNFIIHLIVAAMAVLFGFLFRISYLEWISICVCCAMVLSLELINTSIEKTIDLLHPAFDERAGEIKDIAAAAVLLSAIASVIVGSIIFIPKIIDLI
jgi:diacylglycerol kinase